MKTKLLLVDDHRAMREGLRAMLERQGDVEVVGEADNAVDAVRLAYSLQPDVVIMDVAMPGVDGIEACRQIRSTAQNIRVIALSMHNDRQYVHGMREAGACAYVLKDNIAEDIMPAIRGALGDGMRIPS